MVEASTLQTGVLLQRVRAPSHHVVHFKYKLTIFFVSFTPKLKSKKKKKGTGNMQVCDSLTLATSVLVAKLCQVRGGSGGAMASLFSHPFTPQSPHPLES